MLMFYISFEHQPFSSDKQIYSFIGGGFYSTVHSMQADNCKTERPTFDDGTVRDIIMARFYLCEIPEWYVNKSASRLYVYAPKVHYCSTTFSL